MCRVLGPDLEAAQRERGARVGGEGEGDGDRCVCSDDRGGRAQSDCDGDPCEEEWGREWWAEALQLLPPPRDPLPREVVLREWEGGRGGPQCHVRRLRARSDTEKGRQAGSRT